MKIDDVVVCSGPGSLFQPYITLCASAIFDGEARTVEAKIAQKTGSLRTGCHIFVDGELVGGDRDSRISHPDPKEMEKFLGQGLPNVLLKVGILRFGLPNALIMASFDELKSVKVALIKFSIQMLLFGVGMGTWQWYAAKRAMKKQNRIDAERS